jgi:hypothetical protein
VNKLNRGESQIIPKIRTYPEFNAPTVAPILVVESKLWVNCILGPGFQIFLNPAMCQPKVPDDYNYNSRRNSDHPVDPQPIRGLPPLLTESEEGSAEESL